MRIAYLGPQATYTHQAALKVSQKQGGNAKLEPRTTIEDVFTAVQQGEVDHGVVPFENSSNGSVVFTLDLFADLKGTHTHIVVIDEVFLPVQHCLAGRARSIAATTTNGQVGDATRTEQNDSHGLGHIKKLYSHPQAWGQCNNFLNTYLKGIEKQDVSSTAKGAETVAAEGSTSSSAAISSRLAAELNGLDILAPSIEDVKGNTTRFFVISRLDTIRPEPAIQPSDSTTYKTMIAFTVEHTSPGALADALAVFKKHDLSLTSINTRPSGQAAWMYIFFIEFWGRRNIDEESGAVNAALQELKAAARSYRWLGSWRSTLGD